MKWYLVAPRGFPLQYIISQLWKILFPSQFLTLFLPPHPIGPHASGKAYRDFLRECSQTKWFSIVCWSHNGTNLHAAVKRNLIFCNNRIVALKKILTLWIDNFDRKTRYSSQNKIMKDISTCQVIDWLVQMLPNKVVLKFTKNFLTAICIPESTILFVFAANEFYYLSLFQMCLFKPLKGIFRWFLES